MHFGEVTVEDCFCTPSGVSHKMEWFKKLSFNKAVSLDDGRIEHFVDDATILGCVNLGKVLNLPKRDVRHLTQTVRLCPSEDGTFRATHWDEASQDYIQCNPELAIALMSQAGAYVEVAVNDSSDKYSHFECKGQMEKI